MVESDTSVGDRYRSLLTRIDPDAAHDPLKARQAHQQLLELTMMATNFFPTLGNFETWATDLKDSGSDESSANDEKLGVMATRDLLCIFKTNIGAAIDLMNNIHGIPPLEIPHQLGKLVAGEELESVIPFDDDPLPTHQSE